MSNGAEATSDDNVARAWGAYRQAIEELYQQSIDSLVSAQGEMTEVPTEEAVDSAADRSNELRTAIASNLDAKNSDDRELAMLQLSAAAAIDLSVAHDLAQHAEETDSEAFAAPALSSNLGDVVTILEVPPEAGIWGAIVAGGAPATPASSRDILKGASDSALTGIRDDASATATTTFKGLIGLPGDQLLAAAGQAFSSVFDLVSDKLSWILKKAVKLVANGIAKLLAVFGSSADDVRKKISEWATGLDESGVKDLLGKLYGTENAGAELRSAIEGAPPTSEANMSAAAVSLEGLETKFHRQMEVIGKVASLVSKVRAWLWAVAPPWSQIAVATAYTGATGYVVFAGGDYVDWNDGDGILNLVPGVKSIVEDAVN